MPQNKARKTKSGDKDKDKSRSSSTQSRSTGDKKPSTNKSQESKHLPGHQG
ncbi:MULTISPECIES: hypothetical protein [unclassified Nonomuraea]|uniref:hypothetical protein n=1 Tax=unclassified Nonomuraea TaxID=2593643 RepID=UPI0033C394FE